MLINQIRSKISEGKVREAIKLLQNGSDGHEDELAIHLMQLSLLEKNNRMGIIGFETFNSQISRISFSILELATEINSQGKLNEEIKRYYMPRSSVEFYDSKLEEKWANFFNYVGWDFLVEVQKNKARVADFILKGINKIELEVEIKGIDNISDLRDKSRYIKPEIPNTPLSNCLVLGNRPFVSKDGFYQEQEVIQLGWVFNFDGNQWDNIVLKSNFDISNTKQIIYNLLKKETDYKSFMDSSDFNKIQAIWEGK